MNETARVMSLLNSKFPTCIQQCDVRGAGWFGRFYIVGSVPVSLKGQSWATEDEAIAACVSVGVRRLQRADCSWYTAEVAR